MFTDLLHGTSNLQSLQLNSAVGYEDFSFFVTESDKSIGSLIESYRAVMTEALQESAGQMNESTDLVADQANKHVGQKIMDALKRLWDFIQKMFDSSINFIRTLLASNKAFLDKIKPAVEGKKLTDEQMKKITMSSYDYKPEIIVLSNTPKLLADAGTIAKSQYTPQNKEECDKRVSEFNEQRRKSAGAGKIVAAETLLSVTLSEKNDWGKFKDELHLQLLGGGKKTVKSFSMDFFTKIETYNKNVEDVVKVLDNAKKEFGSLIDTIKKEAARVKDETQDKQFRAGHVAFLNLLRTMVTMCSDAFMELKSMKLSVLKKELSEARAFCMYAYRFKAVQESVVVPFDPLFESDDDSDDADDVLGESTFTF